jgi:ABC-2 type transport system permease protein
VPFGLRPNVYGLVVMLGLLVLLGLLMVSISYALALWLRNEDALAPLLNTITLPVLLLSGVLLPLSLAPGWLQVAALLNPLAHAVDAARALFNEQLGDPSIPRALGIVGALAFVALVVASRSFNRAAA